VADFPSYGYLDKLVDTDPIRLRDEAWAMRRRAELAEAVLAVAQADRARFNRDRDSAVVRAERAEADVARIRAIPRLPHSSEQDGVQGRAYTRGWESVIDAIDRALDVPADREPEATDGR
jgi:hypothetical protein